MPERDRWSWIRGVAAFSAGAVLALLAVELVVRETSFRPWRTDPDFGYVMLPGAEVRFATEGDGRSRWTAHGVRRDALPAPGAPALLVVGDSFTEALMIDDADVYSHRLEAALQGPAVLNVGRSGATAADYLALAPRYQELFAPRWTVIQLRDDDVGDAAWAEGGQARLLRDADGSLAARFEVKQPGRLGALLQPLGAWLATPNYAIVRAGEFLAAFAKEPPIFFGAAGHAGTPEAAGEAGTDRPVEETLARLASAYGGRVTFLWLPNFDPADLAGPGSATEARFEAACRAQALSCVSLRERFPDFAARRESPYGFPNTAWNTGHLNAAGHHAAAALLEAEMRRLAARGLL